MTNVLGESSFTPPVTPVQRYDNSLSDSQGHGPGSMQLHPYSSPSPVLQTDDLLSVNQKLDRVLALFMEQKSAVAQQEREAIKMKEQLSIVVADASQIKKELQTAGTAPRAKKPVPKDISVS